MEGFTLEGVDNEVAERCGDPSGGPDCIIIDEQPAPVPPDLRDACRVGPPQYSKDPIEVDGTRKLQRGTTVTLEVRCPQVLDVIEGTTTLSDVDEQIFQRCSGGEGCSLNAPGAPEDPAARARCTVGSPSYSPPPVDAGPHGSVLDVGTVVTVTVTCA
ncbi:MAG: hypothetical protein ABWY29_04305 [Blastococcus sp.]